MANKVFLGCIADDFTGATDIASFLVAGGMKTLQINGAPTQSPSNETVFSKKILDEYDAVIVALKSRTIAVNDAIEQVIISLKWLRDLGVEKFYFKYCSTFDSTETGNIGPVIDAMCECLGEKSTVLCPALPVNGRTVYQGYLFVHDQLINESPLKNHPLTPMKDASIKRLIERQGSGKAANIDYSQIEKGSDHIADAIHDFENEGYKYIICDALNDKHLDDITEGSKNLSLITGASGLAKGMGKTFHSLGFKPSSPGAGFTSVNAPSVILSGSCSAMTVRQVMMYAKAHASLQVDPLAMARGEQSYESIVLWLEEHLHQSPLIYATASPDSVAEIQQQLGVEPARIMIETLFEKIAQASFLLGVRNFIVAGGETSGAVVEALGVGYFEIGRTITPGVPHVQFQGELASWSSGATWGTCEDTANFSQPVTLNLALKSGNFGNENFFFEALEALTC